MKAGIEIASDATHLTRKHPGIMAVNTCRCFQSTFNAFDITDLGVA